MRMTSAFLCLAACASVPVAAWASDAQSILKRVHERKIERWQGVSDYTIDQSTMGNRVVLHYERIEISGSGGGVGTPAFRMVPLDEVSERHARQQGAPAFTASQYTAMANAYREVGSTTSEAMDAEMVKAGLPPGLLRNLGRASKRDIGVALDPAGMMDGMADFLDFAAAAKRESENRDPTAEARTDMRDAADFASMARLVGREPSNGRNAYLLRADNVNRVQVVDGQQFTIQTVSVWIDVDEYVPLRMKVDGSVRSGGKTTPMTIEKLDLDYRPVGTLFEPHRQVMRIAGMMDAGQEAELRQAQQKMQEMERQVAQMPAAQREMIMRSMGPQMEMMKKMASGGGGIEVETRIHRIHVNAGLPDPAEMAGSMLGSPPAP